MHKIAVRAEQVGPGATGRLMPDACVNWPAQHGLPGAKRTFQLAPLASGPAQRPQEAAERLGPGRRPPGGNLYWIARRWVLSALPLALAIAGCRSGPNREEVLSLVDSRLAERGLGPLGSASATPSGSGKPSLLPPESRSAAFLLMLDELMKDYQPSIGSNDGDALRCTTTDTIATDAYKEVAKKVRDAKASARKARVEFERVVRPLNFRIDPDWKARGGKSPAVYDGWWMNSQMWDPYVQTKQTCEEGSGGTKQWRLRQPEGEFVFTYSRSKDPPKDPPELMARIEQRKIEIPARFFCRVDDVVPHGDKKLAICRSSQSDPPVVRITAPVAELHVGDLISVPLAHTRRDPEGVLLKLKRRVDGKDVLVWAVDAGGDSVKIEQAATCPTREEIDRALGVSPAPSAVP